jgi:hypothetical protein
MGWNAGAEIVLEILDGQGGVLASQVYRAEPANRRIKTQARQSGWFSLRLTGRGLPDAGVAYELTVTYIGTQELRL